MLGCGELLCWLPAYGGLGDAERCACRVSGRGSGRVSARVPGRGDTLRGAAGEAARGTSACLVGGRDGVLLL